MNEVLKLTIVYATVVMSIAFLIGELIPRQIAMMFTSDENLIRISTNGMRIVVAVFPIVGIQMVVANFFQSIGKASKSVFLSATRQLIFLMPLLFVLPRFFGTNGVWLSMPISDALATVIAIILLYNEFRRKNER